MGDGNMTNAENFIANKRLAMVFITQNGKVVRDYYALGYFNK